MVGELDAGKLHVQFDEGAQETSDIAARLCPTLPKPLPSLFRGPSVPATPTVGAFCISKAAGTGSFTVVE